MDKYKIGAIIYLTVFMVIGVIKRTEAAATAATAPVDCNVFPIVKEADCCDLPTLIDQPILDECDNSFKDKSNETRDCFVNECVFKKRKLIKNEKPSIADIQAMINDAARNSPELKPLMQKTLDYCVNKYQTVDPKELKKIDNCNPIYEYLTDCFFTYSYLNCPKSAYKGELDDCKVIKKFLETCATRFL